MGGGVSQAEQFGRINGKNKNKMEWALKYI
jgi:hypothetical protein